MPDISAVVLVAPGYSTTKPLLISSAVGSGGGCQRFTLHAATRRMQAYFGRSAMPISHSARRVGGLSQTRVPCVNEASRAATHAGMHWPEADAPNRLFM